MTQQHRPEDRTDHDIPVLSAGGGPVGILLAAELAHYGVPVTVLEISRAGASRRPVASTA